MTYDQRQVILDKRMGLRAQTQVLAYPWRNKDIMNKKTIMS